MAVTKAAKRTHQVGSPATEEVDDVATESDVKFSILDKFRQTIQATNADAEPYGLVIPTREDITLLFDVTKLDYDTYQAWLRRAEDKKRRGEYNYFNLAITTISNLNTGIKLEGHVVHDWTVASPELHTMLGVAQGATRAAIRALFNNMDGHIIQMMRMVVEKAGFTMDGDVREDEDPLDN